MLHGRCYLISFFPSEPLEVGYPDRLTVFIRVVVGHSNQVIANLDLSEVLACAGIGDVLEAGCAVAIMLHAGSDEARRASVEHFGNADYFTVEEDGGAVGVY